ncbi:MAG: LysR family transcriptional regulator [Coriobacteriales bacterium]|nr:LysR family transcriptional regulator [Coriobacteriales bacterium]
MNTNQLECFVQVAQSLSFRRAAEKLHLSQPTVSKQISTLEADLNGTLFVRSTREVRLTALGESFLRDANEILRLSYAAEERARRYAMGCDLAVAYSDSNELMRLAPVLDRLRKCQEGLHVQLQQGPRDANVSLLAREQVDVVMGFGTRQPSEGGVRFVSLIKSGLSCVVRTDSPLADLDEVGPEDVAGMPQIVCLPPALRRHGSPAQSEVPMTASELTTYCSTSSEAYGLVDAGFGYALVPSLYTMPDPYHRVLTWKGKTSAAYGVCYRKDERQGVVADFVRIAREVYAWPGYERPLPEAWKLA